MFRKSAGSSSHYVPCRLHGFNRPIAFRRALAPPVCRVCNARLIASWLTHYYSSVTSFQSLAAIRTAAVETIKSLRMGLSHCCE